MYTSLKQHILSVLRGADIPTNGIGGPLLKPKLKLECEDSEIRAAAGELEREQAIWLKHFSPAAHEPLAFVIRPGAHFHKAILWVSVALTSGGTEFLAVENRPHRLIRE